MGSSNSESHEYAKKLSSVLKIICYFNGHYSHDYDAVMSFAEGSDPFLCFMSILVTTFESFLISNQDILSVLSMAFSILHDRGIK